MYKAARRNCAVGQDFTYCRYRIRHEPIILIAKKLSKIIRQMFHTAVDTSLSILNQAIEQKMQNK
jgi:hypothetical protein